MKVKFVVRAIQPTGGFDNRTASCWVELDFVPAVGISIVEGDLMLEVEKVAYHRDKRYFEVQLQNIEPYSIDYLEGRGW